MKILVLNAGSSSLKIALFAGEQPLVILPPAPLWTGTADWEVSQGNVVLHVSTLAGATHTETSPAGARATMVRALLELLWKGTAPAIKTVRDIAIVGHRIVNGGPAYLQSVAITPAVIAAISQFTAIDPAHGSTALEDVAMITEVFGAIPQVAAFDTTFHAHIPPAAAVYPGPYAWFEQGIHRFGFHGLSHQYCAERAAMLLGRDLASLRLITCHLGSGSSLAAIRAGMSIETTMGFTPLEGVMMNTRSGSVDPGALLYLLRSKGYTAERLEHELYQESGLLGISGVSSDLRQILAARAQGHPRAQLAYAMYVHRLSAGIGMMLAALGGTDAIVFTGGVGEHLAEIRSAACLPFTFMGLALDETVNSQPSQDRIISTAQSKVAVLVLHTEEEWMIARDCQRLSPNW